MLRLFGLLLTTTLVICPHRVWSQASQISMSDMLKVLDQHPHHLQSALGESVDVNRETQDFTRINHISRPPKETTRHVRWGFKGEKRFRQYIDASDPISPNALHNTISRTCTRIFDGKRAYLIYSTQYTGQVSPYVQADVDSVRANEVTPLFFGYQYINTWLVDVLRKGHYRIDGTVNDARFGLLYRISETKTPGTFSRLIGSAPGLQATRFWLAPKYGFLAVRSENEVDSSQGHQLLVFQLKSLVKQDSIWFPTQGVMDAYSVEDGKNILLTETEVTVTKFKINNVSDDLFDPHLGPGSFVKDGETNQYWKVGPHGERQYIDLGNKSVLGVQPFGWLFIASITSLLLLGIGALLRWRNRHVRS